MLSVHIDLHFLDSLYLTYSLSFFPLRFLFSFFFRAFLISFIKLTYIAAYQQLKINDRHYRSLRSQSAEKQLDNGLDSNLILTDNYEDNYIDAVTRKTSNSRSSLHIEVLSSQSKVTGKIETKTAI